MKKKTIDRQVKPVVNSIIPLISISDLKPGMIIRHKGSSEGYIVTANYGNYAFAVRTMHVSNPSEWLIVKS